jgi:hypothetical protein
MYLRPCYRRKNGKRHAYWALVESLRTEQGPRQRVVAYLGEMDRREKERAMHERFERRWKTLAQLCRRAGLGDEPRRVFQVLQQIKVVDVVLPTRTGVEIRKRCVTRPTEHQAILLDRLGLHLPSRLQVIDMQ